MATMTLGRAVTLLRSAVRSRDLDEEVAEATDLVLDTIEGLLARVHDLEISIRAARKEAQAAKARLETPFGPQA